MSIVQAVKNVMIALVMVCICGCGPNADERYDTGYSDGYAEGYNTTCKIRATLVEGDWDDENYSRGYRVGNAAGAAACKSKK